MFTISSPSKDLLKELKTIKPLHPSHRSCIVQINVFDSLNNWAGKPLQLICSYSIRFSAKKFPLGRNEEFSVTAILVSFAKFTEPYRGLCTLLTVPL